MSWRVRKDSPLKSPPLPISERQIMFLDGIRHGADMAAIALDRLWLKLCAIDQAEESTSADIAEAALDAWSIIDAAHRVADLIANLPGLPNAPWRRMFADRMREALPFRDEWQHQVGEAARVVAERGQMWGALAWAQHDGSKPTGHWFLAVIGSDLKDSSWIYAGPVNPIPRVDSRRIRLLHCNRSIYLNRLVHDIFDALGSLERDIASGKLVLRGDCVNQERSKDWVMSMGMYVVLMPSNNASTAEAEALSPECAED